MVFHKTQFLSVTTNTLLDLNLCPCNSNPPNLTASPIELIVDPSKSHALACPSLMIIMSGSPILR